MAQYKLHCFCQSGNSYKVALYLACSELDWEPVFVDFMHGATREPKWRESVNGMGEAPVLETTAGKLSQSGAIVIQLAERTGKFAPQDEAERMEALRWILFDNHKFTSYFASYRFLKSFAPQAADPSVLAFLQARFESAAGILDKHLGQSKFTVGNYITPESGTLATVVSRDPMYVTFPVTQRELLAMRQRAKEAGIDTSAVKVRLRLADGAPPSDVLTALVARGAVIERFEPALAPMEEIFLRVVRETHA